MKRNAGKSVVSLVAAAVFALLAGCVSVPSADSAAEDATYGSLAEVRP